MFFFEELFSQRTAFLLLISLLLSFLCLWLGLSNISFNRLRNEKVSVIYEMSIWFAVTSRHLGLPFGLLVSSLGTSSMFFKLYEAGEIQAVLEIVGRVTKLVVSGILYGGFLAGLGYFISSKYQHLIQLHEKHRIRPWTVFLTLGLIIILMAGALGIEFVPLIFSSISLSSLGCAGFVIFIALLSSNKKNKFQLLSKASLFGSLMCIVIGITLQFKYPYIGIMFAFMGVFYGLFCYVSIYLLAYCSNSINEVKPELMSWHWIEAYTFLLFMFLAPATLRDYIVADEQALEFERLEQRIEQLENSQEINLKKQ